MTEIELKAHVADPAGTEAIIRGFATFIKETNKSDTYWARPATAAQSAGATGVAHNDPPLASGANGAREAGNTWELNQATKITAYSLVASFAVALAAAGCALVGASKYVILGVCLGGFALVAAVSFILKRRAGNQSVTQPSSVARGTCAESDDGDSAGRRPIKVRIREEDGKTVVTYKRKELQGDIEVNDEREFAIDDRAAFEALIADLGFAPDIAKEKTTKCFEYRAPDGTVVNVELSLVGALGWFIELEILAEEPSEAQTASAQRTLRATLALAGIGESAIEPRYYTDMLKALRR
jgi:adenylate cyclase class 2